MKKTLLTLALVAVCASGFAQGKVKFVNDAASLITLGGVGNILPADNALANLAVGNQTPLLSGVVLVAGLYAGTSAGSLTLYSTTTINNNLIPAGNITSMNVQLNSPAIAGIASGTAIGASTPFFQFRVWDSAFATYEATPSTSYKGQGILFQANPGPSLAYTVLAPGNVNSTYTSSPIIVTATAVPEPGTLALAGLGAASLLLFRRKK